jgi:hypothetical protein
MSPPLSMVCGGRGASQEQWSKDGPVELRRLPSKMREERAADVPSAGLTFRARGGGG